MRFVVFSLCGLLVGVLLGIGIIFGTALIPRQTPIAPVLTQLGLSRPIVIGFLPFWLLNQAKADYSPYITTLDYFDLTLQGDGSIKKLTNPQEEDPGWYALSSGRFNQLFHTELTRGVTLSLVVFTGDNDTITSMMQDPKTSASNMVRDVLPIMKQNNFSDLNLDIEQTAPASPAAQLAFTQFVKTIKSGLKQANARTLTVDVSPSALIKNNLIIPKDIEAYADQMLIMGYDYHYIGSSVTGAVAPLNGVGKTAEYDVQTAVTEALRVLPPEKIVLGIPTYGYSWETLSNFPHAAVIPGTGLISSDRSTSDFLTSCASCSAALDTIAKESYVIYQDQETGTYHQDYYPNEQAMQEKINVATKNHLAGVGIWALGYEDSSVLNPLKKYKQL